MVRRITGSGLSVRRQKGREILLGDPHEGAQAVGAQRAGLNPAAGGARRDGASLGDLLDGPQMAGLTTYGGGLTGPQIDPRAEPARRRERSVRRPTAGRLCGACWPPPLSGGDENAAGDPSFAEDRTRSGRVGRGSFFVEDDRVMRVPFPTGRAGTARLGRAFPGVAVEFWVVRDDEGCAQEQKASIPGPGLIACLAVEGRTWFVPFWAPETRKARRSEPLSGGTPQRGLLARPSPAVKSPTTAARVGPFPPRVMANSGYGRVTREPRSQRSCG